MDFRHTRHQVPRGSRPDGENNDTWALVKRVSLLRLTYQIRLLTFGASQTGRRLLIEVPQRCALSRDLNAFIKANKKIVKIERTD